MAAYIATATVVFSGRAEPAELAAALIARPEVTTVRIGEPGRASVFRIDVEGPDRESAAAAIERIGADLAAKRGAQMRLQSISLVADRGRPLRPPSRPGAQT